MALKGDTHFVNALPQPYPDRRAPRLNLSDNTPAVLRFEDGHRTQAQLEIISVTGGLLALPKPVVRQSRVKLMFVTPTGPVLGTAEMLKPVSWGQQPFRFVGLEKDDQRRLQESRQPLPASAVRPKLHSRCQFCDESGVAQISIVRFVCAEIIPFGKSM